MYLTLLKIYYTHATLKINEKNLKHIYEHLYVYSLHHLQPDKLMLTYSTIDS